MKDIPCIIAIDGTAASGKGTLAKKLADYYGFDYMDTGLLYRSVGVLTKMRGGDPSFEKDAVEAAQYFVDHYLQNPLEGQNLKTVEAGPLASKAAQHQKVRTLLYHLQRDFGEQAKKGAVIDGRDIASVIFPDALVKIYVDADVEIRAERRFKELYENGQQRDYKQILKDMMERDERDMNRKAAPAKVTPESLIVDTSFLSAKEVLNSVLAEIDKKIQKSLNKNALKA